MHSKGLQGVLVLALMTTGACAKRAVATEVSMPGAAPAPSLGNKAPNTIGAASPKGAVDAFLAAVNAQDLQAMSALWGNDKGLARDRLKREELEKRLIVMQCLIQHDKVSFPEDRARLSAGGKQEFMVELTRGKNTARTKFTAINGPQGRWYVEDVDVAPLREFCR
jgi:hypothetical protein